jgi:hypothetical protein
MIDNIRKISQEEIKKPVDDYHKKRLLELADRMRGCLAALIILNEDGSTSTTLIRSVEEAEEFIVVVVIWLHEPDEDEKGSIPCAPGCEFVVTPSAAVEELNQMLVIKVNDISYLYENINQWLSYSDIIELSEIDGKKYLIKYMNTSGEEYEVKDGDSLLIEPGMIFTVEENI